MDDVKLAIVVLATNQQQLDQDGIMVGVSRQALEKVLAHLRNPWRTDMENAPDELVKQIGFIRKRLYVGSPCAHVAVTSDGTRYAVILAANIDDPSFSWMPLPPEPTT